MLQVAVCDPCPGTWQQQYNVILHEIDDATQLR